MNYIADKLDTPITGILASVKDHTKGQIIETELLDGTYIIQSVGNPQTTLEVIFYCSSAVRRQLELSASIGEPIYIYWKGSQYRGLIEKGEISWERWSRNKSGLAEELTFSLRVWEAD